MLRGQLRSDWFWLNLFRFINFCNNRRRWTESWAKTWLFFCCECRLLCYWHCFDFRCLNSIRRVVSWLCFAQCNCVSVVVVVLRLRCNGVDLCVYQFCKLPFNPCEIRRILFFSAFRKKNLLVLRQFMHARFDSSTFQTVEMHYFSSLVCYVLNLKYHVLELRFYFERFCLLFVKFISDAVVEYRRV